MQQRGIFRPSADGIAFRGFTDVHFASVDVYDCTGRPDEWKKLHSIPL